MKIVFEWPFKTYSGTLQEMTYQSCRHGNLCMGRDWVKPDNTVNNARLGRIAQNLIRIWDSANPAYKEDLKLYARLYKAQKLKAGQFPPTAYSIFVKLMYAWQRSSAQQVDLATVTLAELVELDAAVCSVAKAVLAQLIKPVKGYDALNYEL